MVPICKVPHPTNLVLSGQSDGLGLREQADSGVFILGPDGKVILDSAVDLCQGACHGQGKRIHTAKLAPQVGTWHSS